MYHNLVNIIMESESPCKFESRWSEVMETTRLGDNEWLCNMYEIRPCWIPAYVRHIFSAGMSSSQRSKSNNAFFKRYVNKKNTLMDFITRFSNALAHQRYGELAANHTDLNEQPWMTTSFAMEVQMASIYTKTIFLRFQTKLAQSTYYLCSKTSTYEGLKTYSVMSFEKGKTYDRQHEVLHYMMTDIITCSCRTFEFEGYPCRHMLSLMIKKQVMLLLNHYIVRRWTQTAKAIPIFEPITDPSTGHSLISRHGMLSRTASELVDEEALTDARTTFLMDGFRDLKLHVKDVNDGGDIRMSRMKNKSKESTQHVVDPTPIRTKECGKRLKSSKELAMSQSRRNCRGCGRSEHDRRTCPALQPK